MTFFLELLAPPLCAACVSFGGYQGGVTYQNISVGIGSINQKQNDGQIEHDTVFLSLSTPLYKPSERTTLGAFTAFTFNPTPEPRAQPKSIQTGPYEEYNLTKHVALRAYEVLSQHPKDSQLMFSLRYTF